MTYTFYIVNNTGSPLHRKLVAALGRPGHRIPEYQCLIGVNRQPLFVRVEAHTTTDDLHALDSADPRDGESVMNAHSIQEVPCETNTNCDSTSPVTMGSGLRRH